MYKMTEFDDIILREKDRKLFIARMPKNVKEEFIKFAEQEFCDDYGLCFKHIWDSYKMWKFLFENLDYKLDQIIGLIQNKENPETKGVKSLSGRKIKKEKEEKKDGENR